jgi:hypothetical protein
VKVNVYSSVEALPATYHPLFQEWGRRSFDYGLPWLRNLAQNALDRDDEIRIYGAERSDAYPVAVLATRRKSGAATTFRDSRTLLGLANYYTSRFTPLVDTASRDMAAGVQDVVEAVCSDSPRWDSARFTPIDAELPSFGLFVDSLRRCGMIVQTYFAAGNWYYPVDGRSFDEYLRSLRSSVRNIAKSKVKKLERSGRARLEIVTGGPGLESAIAAYERVYATSWKVPEPYPSFVPGLIRTCAESGTLRLGVVFMEDEPAAAQLWIVNEGVASIFKIAYDPRFAEFSVGTFLTLSLMRHVIDVDKVHEVDYLTGDDGYKKDWMSHRRERTGILALNPRTVRGALGILRHAGGRAIKRAVGTWVRTATAQPQAG